MFSCIIHQIGCGLLPGGEQGSAVFIFLKRFPGHLCAVGYLACVIVSIITFMYYS